MHQPREVLSVLGRHHVRELNDYQQRLVAAICVGWTPQDIAAASGRSSKSVYRHIRELACHVLDPVGFEPTRDFLRTWAELHGTCCCAPAFKMIRKTASSEKYSQIGPAPEGSLMRAIGDKGMFREVTRRQILRKLAAGPMAVAGAMVDPLGLRSRDAARAADGRGSDAGELYNGLLLLAPGATRPAILS